MGSPRRIGRIAVGAVALALILVAAAWIGGARLLRAADPLDAGRSAYQSGDYARAAAEARTRLRAQAGDPEALRLLARALARQGRGAEARAIFDRLGVESWQAEDLALVAEQLDAVGNKQLARASFSKAVEVEPDHPDALAGLARVELALDNPHAAAAPAERLARLPGQEARGLLMLGAARRELSDPAGAGEAIERALQLSPQLKGSSTEPATARRFLARCWLAAGRPERAVAALASMDDPESSWLRGRARLQQGQTGIPLPPAPPGTDPAEPEPAPLIGADRCVACHREKARAVADSRHARTYTPPATIQAVPLPDRPVDDPYLAGVVHQLRRDGDQVTAETRSGGDVARALVQYAFGSGRRAQTLAGRDDAGQEREIRLTRYGGTHWDLTTGQARQPRAADAHAYLGRPLSADALRRCLSCHTTDFRAARDGVGPAGSDHAIGCERCHGPGGNHLKAIEAGLKDPCIGRPRLADGVQESRLCSGCHSPRDIPLSPKDPAAPRFQGAGMAWSRCFTASDGRLSCTTCHDPHRDAETSAAFYEAKCLGCHAEHPPEVPESAGHTRRAALPEGRSPTACPVEPARGCLDCHMPAVDAAVPHTTYTDHFIRVRDDRGPAAAQGPGPAAGGGG